MKRITLNNATLAYHDLAGPPEAVPALLLHGFTGTAEAHMGLIIEELRGTRRVVAPDLRGYGASRPPVRDFPPDFYGRDADDMAALLDALGLAGVHLIGFSDGAESALLLASRRPDLARSVFVWGACGVLSEAEEEKCNRWLPVAENWNGERAGWRDEIIALQGADQFAPMVEGWVAAANAIVAGGRDISLAAAAAIRCPVLLLNGDGEEGNPPDDARRLVARIPHGELRFVKDSGHGIQWDQPNVLIAALRTFIAPPTAPTTDAHRNPTP